MLAAEMLRIEAFDMEPELCRRLTCGNQCLLRLVEFLMAFLQPISWCLEIRQTFDLVR